MNLFKASSWWKFALAALWMAAAAPGLAADASVPVMRTPLAPGLYELAYSERQDALYVASAGDRGAGAQPSRILKLHPGTLAVQAEIVLAHGGYGLALDDAAQRLYVGHAMDAAITVIDLATDRVAGVVQLAQKVRAPGFDGQPVERFAHSLRELVVDPARHRLYAPGAWFTDSALYVVDTRRLQVEKVLPDFGFLATGIALDAQRAQVWVSNLQGQLFRVDARSLAVTRLQAGGDQLLNLALDPATHEVWATDQGLPMVDGMRREQGGLADYVRRGDGNRIVVLDPDSGRLRASLPTQPGPVALLLDARRERLYVTQREAGTLAIFDSRTSALLHTIELPAHPNSLALDAKRNVLYVSIKNAAGGDKGAAESVARIALP